MLAGEGGCRDAAGRLSRTCADDSRRADVRLVQLEQEDGGAASVLLDAAQHEGEGGTASVSAACAIVLPSKCLSEADSTPEMTTDSQPLSATAEPLPCSTAPAAA
jgi:hypothetical protein